MRIITSQINTSSVGAIIFRDCEESIEFLGVKDGNSFKFPIWPEVPEFGEKEFVISKVKNLDLQNPILISMVGFSGVVADELEIDGPKTNFYAIFIETSDNKVVNDPDKRWIDIRAGFRFIKNSRFLNVLNQALDWLYSDVDAILLLTRQQQMIK